MGMFRHVLAIGNHRGIATFHSLHSQKLKNPKKKTFLPLYGPVLSTNLHGLFVDRIIPQTIALYKSITQVRDRSLGFEK